MDLEIGVSTSVDVNKSSEDLSVNKLKNDVIESLDIDSHEVPGSKQSHEEDDYQTNDDTIDPSCSPSESLPTTLKPVSAMKGSREKQREGPTQKLSVKWDPEVYDPVPTSVSHAVTNNKPRRQGKKNSKSKQKNGSKSSRGNKNKDKSAGKRSLV